MMTNKELGAKIRADLKAAGIPARSVSVRVSDAGYSTSIRVKIKDISVDRQLVERIAGQHEEIRRDERSYEILEGCNTFVFVDWDSDMLDAERRKYFEAAKKIIDAEKCATVMECKGAELHYIHDAPGSIYNKAQVCRKGRCGYDYDMGRYAAYNAYKLAEAMAVFAAHGKLM